MTGPRTFCSTSVSNILGFGSARVRTAMNTHDFSRPDATPAASRKPQSLRPSVAKLMAERDGLLPVWVRAPKTGLEHYSGLTRPYLYRLAGEGKIRTASIREPHQIRGCRLFCLRSILELLESHSCPQESAGTSVAIEKEAE
jgi:hypothetical protein